MEKEVKRRKMKKEKREKKKDKSVNLIPVTSPLITRTRRCRTYKNLSAKMHTVVW